jgi:hypothetical protein
MAWNCCLRLRKSWWAIRRWRWLRPPESKRHGDCEQADLVVLCHESS